MHAHGLALEAGVLVIDDRTFLHDQARRGEVVLVGEIHRLLAVFVDGHGRQRHVDFLHLQGRNQTVELTFDPHTLDLHLRAQGVADVVVETNDFTFIGFRGKWWIRRFDTDAQGFLGGKNRAARQQAQGQTGNEGELLHVRFLAVVVGLARQKKKLKRVETFFVLIIPYWTFMYASSMR
ncbi:hypothetical protein D9M73_174560 [compost metagenome]